MARRVRVARRAAGDIAAARAWLVEPGSGPRAWRKLSAIEAAIDDLALHPCRWPRGELAGTRHRVVSEYMLVYRVTPDTGDDRTAGEVRVLRIFGPGQDRRSA